MCGHCCLIFQVWALRAISIFLGGWWRAEASSPSFTYWGGLGCMWFPNLWSRPCIQTYPCFDGMKCILSLLHYFKCKMKDCCEPTKSDLVSVNQTEVTRGITIDGLDEHVRRCGEDGVVISHIPSWLCSHVVCCEPVDILEEVFDIPKVGVMVIDTN